MDLKEKDNFTTHFRVMIAFWAYGKKPVTSYRSIVSDSDQAGASMCSQYDLPEK